MGHSVRKNVQLESSAQTVSRHAIAEMEIIDAAQLPANVSVLLDTLAHNVNKCVVQANTDQGAHWNANVTTVEVAILSVGHAFALMDGSVLLVSMLVSLQLFVTTVMDSTPLQSAVEEKITHGKIVTAIRKRQSKLLHFIVHFASSQNQLTLTRSKIDKSD